MTLVNETLRADHNTESFIPAWFENDRFWSTFRSVAFGGERWSRACAEAPQILRLLGLENRRGSILDLCSGPGRYSLEFALRGLTVTAVDRTESYLAELRDRAKTVGCSIETVREDMRQFERSESFDAAICIGLSFGYFEHSSEDCLVLERIHASLRPGAHLVIQVPNKCWPDALGTWFLVENESVHALVDQRVEAGGKRVIQQWMVRDDAGQTFNFTFKQTLYSPDELASTFMRVGFLNTRFFEDFGCSPLRPDSRHLIVVAEK